MYLLHVSLFSILFNILSIFVHKKDLSLYMWELLSNNLIFFTWFKIGMWKISNCIEEWYEIVNVEITLRYLSILTLFWFYFITFKIFNIFANLLLCLYYKPYMFSLSCIKWPLRYSTSVVWILRIRHTGHAFLFSNLLTACNETRNVFPLRILCNAF